MSGILPLFLPCMLGVASSAFEDIAGVKIAERCHLMEVENAGVDRAFLQSLKPKNAMTKKTVYSPVVIQSAL